MIGNLAGTILLLIGLFAGLGVFLATMYSMTQVLLIGGRLRIAHALTFLLVMAIMTVLYLWRDVAVARLLSFPLVPVALWTLWLEQRWYRIFPGLILIFALVLVAGYVALNPI